MTSRPLAFALAGALLLGIVLLLAARSGNVPLSTAAPALAAPAPRSATTLAPAAVGERQNVSDARTVTPTQLETLRARFANSSLRGAAPDGAINLDPSGRVLADLDLRRLFDWYLTLSGEFSPAEIRSLFDATLRETHGEVVALDAMALFDRYLDLQRATAALDRGLAADAFLAETMRLRREYFGDAAADAMFGADETAQQHTLDRIAVLADPALTPDERTALADALDARLPPDERAARELASADVADTQSRRFDADATDAATRAAERTELFGADAARRLAALDAERAAWDARVAAYRRARAALDADTTLPATRRAEQLAALRERSFDAAERRRVDAIERIGLGAPGD